MKNFLGDFLLTIVALLFISSSLCAQNKNNLILQTNFNMEYKNNVLLPQTNKVQNDFKMRSALLLGYKWFSPNYQKNISLTYENRYQRYLSFNDYTKFEHLFRLTGSYSILPIGRLFINETYKIRDYKYLSTNNYYRNLLTIFAKNKITSKISLYLSYGNWLKSYPNNHLLKTYTSNRFYTKLDYSLNNSTNLGIRVEYQMHKGDLFPYNYVPNSMDKLSGVRYSVEIMSSTILKNSFLVDFKYRYESDIPNNLNIQNQQEDQGDEELQYLLIEDPDFDYEKNQINLSLVYNINTDFSLFIFNVFQLKNFNHWKINKDENILRKDFLTYSSIFLKYKFYKNFNFTWYYNYEKRISNLNSARSHQSVVGVGIQYKF
jgi:hypothetical protein